ncbi:NRDE family protein [Sabulilitoribacter arenilitoris]|uniref:NRDE family protein n=1 Tax=Wocania arenilitoris TaxID=2044858 RepID=A0AAE3JLY9_9FLAO|nr:NRDE family protein [Wocania arenilitoris]MCF7568824.1 NRDE family protein [Wocania arenilitoris]
MCTVTLIYKGKNDFVLTSNRDEAPNRTSLKPEIYAINNTKVLFPKDEFSGGTWIGASEKNRVVCVLNGAFKFHKRKSKYRLSRGIVANDFLITDDIIKTIENYNFDDIEPFTIVIVDWNFDLKFHELVWDGTNTYFTELPLETKIWSSSTLYSKAMKSERLKWFEDFKTDNILDKNTLLIFHKTAGKNNDDYGVIMNRGFVKTTSITQIEKSANNLIMHYESLVDNTVTTKNFYSPQVVNE